MKNLLPPSPFEVLIVAKTRMQRGYCVGGITYNGRSVRLCVPAKEAVANYNCEYKIGDVWLIEKYTIPSRLIPPHTEDIYVHSKSWKRKAENTIEVIEKLMPPVIGGVDCLFDGSVQCAKDGRLHIAKSCVPQYSTLFWRPDRPLHLTFSSKGSSRYVYDTGVGKCFFSYVGTRTARSVLPAGTLIRVSLARWLKPETLPDAKEACYLQVSGWFDEDGSHGEADEEAIAIPVSGSKTVIAPIRKPVQADLPALLKRHFGFEEFRQYQQEIIESVLARRDVSVVMATGAGKSLCYQLPALAFEGLTVVVSPLIALMEDQVLKLNQFGIPAAALNSHTPGNEARRIKQRIRNNQLKLLYLAPERLVLPATIDLLQMGRVECLVVDESHCISQWGHDFRPDYRNILSVREALGNVPILALTATATPDVRMDIVTNLKLQNVHEVVAPFNRPNLFLAVLPRNNGYKQVLDFLENHPGQSGIIYCQKRNSVDELAEKLQQAGVNALPYHAGLPDEIRKQNQWRFIHDDGVVMVATIAFGMGIDKPDIRFVVHYNMPRDPESYYQQIGRAGRDGERADCLLLHAPDDLKEIKRWIAEEEPEHAAESVARLQHMEAWIKEFSCRRKWLLEYFGETDVPEYCGMCDACASADGMKVIGSDDITPYALLFLSCVIQVKQSFGREHIINVLRGSKNQKVLSWKHEQLPIYQQGRALTHQEWQELAEQFFQVGLGTTGYMKAVKLTPRGQAVLDGAKVYGHFKGKPKVAAAPVADDPLFEKLRQLRRQLADERGIPAFAICHDSTLHDMAKRMPQTTAEFLSVHGVGVHKCKVYGEVFLNLIREHCQSAAATAVHTLPVEKRKTTSKAAAEARRKKAIAGLQAGKPLDDVAKECGVKPVTVIGYLLRYHTENGKLPDGLKLPKAQVPDTIRREAFWLFTEYGTETLKPIYLAMEERVEYSDLALLRLEYLQHMTP